MADRYVQASPTPTPPDGGATSLATTGLPVTVSSADPPANGKPLVATGPTTASWGFSKTVTPGGTTGDQTINKSSGTVNIAASATSINVINSLVTVNSIVFAVIRTNDVTAQILNVVPASGSFTINMFAAPTAETSVGFFVIS